MLISMIYLLVGIAVISTIIELMRRQYNEAWRKMQELRAQIQAQLKLAATLRQMADQAGKNNIEFEGELFLANYRRATKSAKCFRFCNF